MLGKGATERKRWSESSWCVVCVYIRGKMHGGKKGGLRLQSRLITTLKLMIMPFNSTCQERKEGGVCVSVCVLEE